MLRQSAPIYFLITFAKEPRLAVRVRAVEYESPVNLLLRVVQVQILSVFPPHLKLNAILLLAVLRLLIPQISEARSRHLDVSVAVLRTLDEYLLGHPVKEVEIEQKLWC